MVLFTAISAKACGVKKWSCSLPKNVVVKATTETNKVMEKNLNVKTITSAKTFSAMVSTSEKR